MAVASRDRFQAALCYDLECLELSGCQYPNQFRRVPLVVEMLAKETVGVSADNVRAGLLRLDVYAKLSTRVGHQVCLTLSSKEDYH